jgi:hypothetical protein
VALHQVGDDLGEALAFEIAFGKSVRIANARRYARS